MRLEVSSSNFPQFDRNMNTTGRVAQEANPVIAVQQIYHDGVRPSHLVLPIIPRKKQRTRVCREGPSSSLLPFLRKPCWRGRPGGGVILIIMMITPLRPSCLPRSPLLSRRVWCHPPCCCPRSLACPLPVH
ncbi:MAG: hypothetical protein OK474_04290 [Thaumarchaeota archaeon]|nr:hypothetical protein [Nitrososphaerota archaeon]